MTISKQDVIIEAYKAYTGDYPTKSCMLYLTEEVNKEIVNETITLYENGNKMNAIIRLANDVARVCTNAFKLGIKL